MVIVIVMLLPKQDVASLDIFKKVVPMAFYIGHVTNAESIIIFWHVVLDVCLQRKTTLRRIVPLAQ